MALGIILGVIIVALIIGAIGWSIYAADDCNTLMSVIAGILAFVLIISFIVVPFSIHTVDTGKIAVVKHLGKIKTIRESGTYYDFWMTNKYVKYDTKVKEVIIKEMAYSSDAQQMSLEIKFQYQIMPDKVKDITTKYGELSMLEARIQPIVIEKVKSMLSQHTAMNIIANRSQLSPDAEELVKTALGEEYYINVVSVSLTNIDFSDQFETAVEDKMIAEQTKLKADYENETKIAKAEAEAKAKIVSAEATAKANELLERSLTDKILQEMYINKWDGKLPQVITDGDTIFQIPELNGETN
jgi:regulator of protease activity HflC (stomatin/prohibitin superfamily)